MMKKLITMLMLLALSSALLPGTAFAVTASDIALGTGALQAEANTSTAATVYFGTYSTPATPVAYRVIGYGGSGVASTAGDATLLARDYLAMSRFDGIDNAYGNSDLRTAVDAFKSALSAGEQAAVLPRTLVSGVYEGDDTDCIAGPEVTDALLWPLSTKEANQVNPALRVFAQWWWLRSPGFYRNFAASVFTVGSVYRFGNLVHNVNYAVRPAFHLNLSSVLFTSAAAGGKISNPAGAGALAVNPAYSGTQWKLTVLDNAADSGREGFDVSTSGASTPTAGGDVSVSYSGAKEGTKEYLSAMIVNGSGEVLYYGRLKNIAAVGDSSGTQAIAIPALPVGSYTLRLFNEQYNGDKMTDYASAMKDVALTVYPAPIIARQPDEQYAVVGQQATFSLSATGEKLRYQWYIDRKDGRGWQALEGKTGSAYTTSAVTAANDGYRYRCSITDAYGNTLTSDTALLYVSPAPVPPSTGDGSRPLLWLGLFLVGGLGLLARRRQGRAS